MKVRNMMDSFTGSKLKLNLIHVNDYKFRIKQ